MNTLFKTIAHSGLIMALVLAPVMPTFADDYKSVCKTQDSDQTTADCTKAHVAKVTKDIQTTKSIIFTTATAYLIVAGCIPYLSGSCPAVSYGVQGAGVALDIAQGIATKNMASALTGSLTSMGTLLATSMAGGGAKIAPLAARTAKDAAGKASQKAAKAACFTAAAGTAVSAGMAIAQTMGAKAAEKAALSSKLDLDKSRPSAGFHTGGAAAAAAGAGGTAGASAKIADAVTDCGSQGGNNYLKCIGQQDPEVAALTNSPDAMTALEDGIGGQSLGDFAKAYTGDGSAESIAAHVANGMGLSSGVSKALSDALKEGDKYATENGYKPSAFTPSSNKVASTGGADLDFNKMMAGMLKQLNPDETKAGEDPSTIVFRQLDLLPPDKIEASKDISLFARIGYRYRKKSADVEQLNWAKPENQTANSTSAPVTTARVPGSSN